jgi:hypothetical protein
MNPEPTNSFFKFTIGFLVFISVSFGVTYAVNTVAVSQEASQQAAAARGLMLEQR